VIKLFIDHQPLTINPYPYRRLQRKARKFNPALVAMIISLNLNLDIMKSISVAFSSTINYLRKFADAMIYPLKDMPVLDFNDEHDSSII